MIATMPRKTRARPLTLTEKLIAWKQRIAKLLEVDTVYQKHAADLLGIPLKTYKNYEPTLRRQPGALAVAELERRMEKVETYLRDGGANPYRIDHGSRDESIDEIVKQILAEKADA